MKKFFVISALLILLVITCCLISCGGSDRNQEIIKDIETYYKDVDGVEKLHIKVTYFDGSTEERTVDVPKRIINIALAQDSFPVSKTAPELKLVILYDDETTETIPVTKDMIKGGAVNFGTIGTYTLELEYHGKTLSTPIYVKDAAYFAIVDGECVEFASPEEMLTRGGEVKLASDVTLNLDKEIRFDKDTVLDLNGFTLKLTGPYEFRVCANVVVKNGTMISEKAYCFMVGTLTDGDVAGIPGTLTIESGNYKADITVAQATNGTVYVNGGTFEVAPYQGSYAYTFNCYDKAYREEPRTADVVITGGTFVNWNPADNAAEGEGTVFAKAGSVITPEEKDGKTFYTVTPAPAA